MRHRTQHKTQQGFVLGAAVFLLLVVAVLGIFVLRLSTIQHTGAALDVMSAQAYQTARAGAEWGLYQTIKTNNSDGINDCTAANTNMSNLNGMTTSVTCTIDASGDATEVGLANIYRITSTACNIPIATGTPVSYVCPGDLSKPNYVERRIIVTVDTTF